MMMKVTSQDRARLEAEAQRLVEQLKLLGAVQVILFGSLARGQISLFSDIDLLAVFDREQSSHELTRWVYQNIQTGEAVDVLAYGQRAFEQVRGRPFFQKILREGKVLYGPAA
jgi:predicted nucleotidyltransferase